MVALPKGFKSWKEVENWHNKYDPGYEKRATKERNYKGFNIKRDKGGEGFTMMVRKKIKGFEEENEMPKEQLNEKKTTQRGFFTASQWDAYLKRQAKKGKKVTVKKEEVEQLDELKPATLRSYTKGAAPDIWNAGVDLGAAREHRPAKWAEREMERHGRKVQKRTEGILKAQDRLGGKYHAKVQSKKNIAATYPAYNVHRYHGEETELDESEAFPQPAVADLVAYAIDQKPLEFSQTFAELMQQHIADEVYNKKLEIAAGVMGGPEDEEEEEESQYVAGDEPEEDVADETETTEEE